MHGSRAHPSNLTNIPLGHPIDTDEYLSVQQIGDHCSIYIVIQSSVENHGKPIPTLVIDYIIDHFLLTGCPKKRYVQGYDILNEFISK